MRLLGRAIRLLFSRLDPVRHWEPQWQVDRGLGRARRLQRLFSSPAWRSHGTRSLSTAQLQDNAADCLFAAVMNLAHQMPLADEAHIFRLWYLAVRADAPPENARRLFGALRDLPAHQQLAAGARMLNAVASTQPGEGASQPRLSPQRPFTNQSVGESG